MPAGKKDMLKREILMATAYYLRSILGSEIDSIKVERAVIGLFFSGVKLSNGEGGICFTPVKEIPEAVCCPSSLRAMPECGKLTGQPVSEYIANLQKESPLQTALGISVLNALSSTYWRRNPPSGYILKYGADPLENKTIADDAKVVVVGALVPYIRMLKARGRQFHILEKDPRTLKENEMQFYCPPEKSLSCIESADILIVTGTTLINNTLEDILSQVKCGAEVILVGPTASMIPDAFFQRGVNSIGGVMVTDPDAVLDTLTEAGSGYHFYGKSAERVVICKDDPKNMVADKAIANQSVRQ